MQTISEFMSARDADSRKWKAAVRNRKILKLVGQGALIAMFCLVLLHVAHKALEKAVQSNFTMEQA